MGPLVRIVLIAAGSVFVVLGILGMFLPLVPTTVFLLLAAWCYARSSDRFHRWLLDNRLFGDYIRNYRDGRGLSVREKAVTLGMLWASIGYSVLLAGLEAWVDLLLLAMAAGVTVHLLALRTYRPERAAPSVQPPDGTGERA
ncbi:MAG: YbaN family protein [Acidobacteriota bacterium]